MRIFLKLIFSECVVYRLLLLTFFLDLWSVRVSQSQLAYFAVAYVTSSFQSTSD